MGMFDYFMPSSLRCPRCGSDHFDLQGKPQWACLFVWKEGNRHPIDQRVDDDCRCRDLSKISLEDTINIYGECIDCGLKIDAIAEVKSGAWASSAIDANIYRATAIDGRYIICGHCNYSCTSVRNACDITTCLTKWSKGAK
jgi:hypothetical protein